MTKTGETSVHGEGGNNKSAAITPEPIDRNGDGLRYRRGMRARMADRIPQRELDVSPNLGDETIAFNYLCLLDNYEIGTFYDTRRSPSAAIEKRTANRN